MSHNEFSPVFVLGAWLITIANYWFGTKLGRNSIWIGFEPVELHLYSCQH
jgi:hypothetical protein